MPEGRANSWRGLHLQFEVIPMSGKYSDNKHKAASRSMSSTRKGLIVAVVFVALLVLAAVIFLLSKQDNAAGDETRPSDPPETSEGLAQSESTDATEESKIIITGVEVEIEEETQPESTEGDTSAGEESSGEVQQTDYVFHLGSDVVIDKYLKYNGAYMEDGTDDVVTDILAIQVTNNGENYIQTMTIVLSDGETEATFVLSTLMPGDTMIVLEQNRMSCSTAPKFTECSTHTVAFFAEAPGMCEDLVEIQTLNGVMNVTNISGADIEGDIIIYYKNYVNGVYYGGKTYRAVISGLKAGEIRQGSVAHFNPSNSVIVFVTCG